MDILTVDVDTWYPSEYFRPSERKDSITIRHVKETLELLRKYRAKATFFLLGEFIERNPQVIDAIYSESHEIGFHSYDHKPLCDYSQDEFRRSLQRFSEQVKDRVDERPIGFRAPVFSIRRGMPWVLDTLEKEGFKYDSSVFPAWTPLYGFPTAPIRPYHPDHWNPDREGNSGLWEIPLLVLRMGPLRIPVAGGFYLRILPASWIWSGIRLAHARSDSAALYFHPRETDPSLPRVSLGISKRFLIYFNLKQVRPLLERILSEYQFKPVKDLLKSLAS